VQELAKLRAKITSTVQVLTHLKEKLQFVNGENLVEKQRLHEVEELVARVSSLMFLSASSRGCVCPSALEYPLVTEGNITLLRLMSLIRANSI